MMQIDLNCDLGESFGRYELDQSEKLLPYITSCNIACGYHAGDPLVMERTIRLALSNEVQIGAHPSYPDLQGFGRRNMQIAPEELKAMILYQISALAGMVSAQGGRITHVKPHGALYNQAAKDAEVAMAIIDAIIASGKEYGLMGLAGSVMEGLAKRRSIPFVAEGFSDRRYHYKGNLISRHHPKALIRRKEEAWDQFRRMVKDHEVISNNGKKLPVHVDSICIHGDSPGALEFVKYIREQSVKCNIEVSPFKLPLV